VQESATRLQQDSFDLLFELSNVDRLNILLELKKSPMRISLVSKKFKSTVPETSRNISRLHAAKLINRDSQGVFHISPYGDEALSILQGFFFLSNHRPYFENHSLSTIPKEFATGIGALEKSKEFNELTTMLHYIENMIKDSEEFFWFSSDQLLANGVALAAEAVSRGVGMKKLLPRKVNIPESETELVNNPAFERAARVNKFESRYIVKIVVALCITDKCSAICFPNLEGKIDFLGFITTDETAHRWTKSLYLHYWNRAKR